MKRYYNFAHNGDAIDLLTKEIKAVESEIVELNEIMRRLVAQKEILRRARDRAEETA